nr:hypothetical protein [uncultured Massilia sp.]
MHKSYFALVDLSGESSGSELVLSEELSEWLFHAGFWGDLERMYSTDFSQYEEEIMTSAMIEYASTLRGDMHACVEGVEGKVIEFRYGWDSDKREMICKVDGEIILAELKELIRFFKIALEGCSNIYCQL